MRPDHIRNLDPRPALFQVPLEIDFGKERILDCAVLVRDCFGTRIMGTVFGAATMASCVGMAAGPLVGGWIFDRFGDYAGMHLASLAVGLGAVAIALTFSPLPRTRPDRLKPA